MARICIKNALFYGSSKMSSLILPWCTFTEPEVAHVGLYPHDMIEKNVKFETFRKDFKDMDRSICEGATQGFVKVRYPYCTPTMRN